MVQHPTAEEVTKNLDLTSKIALVTGFDSSLFLTLLSILNIFYVLLFQKIQSLSF